MSEPGESVETPDRPDPVWREAIHIGVSGPNASVDVGFRPETFVGAHGDVDSAPQLRKLSHRMIADRLFNEVDVVLAQRLQVPHRLRERPTSVRIDTESRLGTEVLPHAGDHLDVLRVTESDLEVEDREACFQAIVHLGAKALLRVTRKVVEVRWLSFLESAEESPERLS